MRALAVSEITMMSGSVRCRRETQPRCQLTRTVVKGETVMLQWLLLKGFAPSRIQCLKSLPNLFLKMNSIETTKEIKNNYLWNRVTLNLPWGKVQDILRCLCSKSKKNWCVCSNTSTARSNFWISKTTWLRQEKSAGALQRTWTSFSTKGASENIRSQKSKGPYYSTRIKGLICQKGIVLSSRTRNQQNKEESTLLKVTFSSVWNTKLFPIMTHNSKASKVSSKILHRAHLKNNNS